MYIDLTEMIVEPYLFLLLEIQLAEVATSAQSSATITRRKTGSDGTIRVEVA
jgi:hypothetical protein